MKTKQTKINTAYIFFAIMGVLLFQNFLMKSFQTQQIAYSQFQSELKAGQIKEIVITDKNIRGLHTDKEGKERLFVTNRVDINLAKELEKHGIKYNQKIESTILRDLLSWIIPTLIFLGIWLFLIRKMAGKDMGGGFLSIGKSKAKIYLETDTKITFKDVAGVDEAKEELMEVINFLKDAGNYGRLGGRLPKGVLLVGPPGTGKTLLAKAVAGEAKVPFFSISGSEFVEMFVGVGAARVRDLFEQARGKAPCIIFIDELDALGRARGMNPMGGHDEKEQTLNQLLSELDGFDSGSGIVLLAATNRPEILDAALLRAGRFDRQILVDKPDKKGRGDILAVHSKNIKMAEGVELGQIAALTTGFTGADLANLVNEAALVATRRNANAVELRDFTEGIERIVAGLEKKNRLLNDFERKIVAHHEMGHALVGKMISSSEEIHKVSIIPRGIGALGYTIQRPTEDRYIMKKEELENKIATLMGGRAAEKIIFHHLSTGASDDLARATDIAKDMVTRFGMDEKLGNMVYDKDQSTFLGPQMVKQRLFSEETGREIDLAVKGILDGAMVKAEEILLKNRELLETSAKLLLVKETLDQKDLAGIFSKIKHL
ncbi:MAG: cell division protein FtsH [Epsilonproteobacteria bacterium]|nr:MAG: cell division protein FtsH [Campylobacterota bacterium]RLA66356.1 MAG: cell division protein FtsH [Campylobacterota bacterium]